LFFTSGITFSGLWIVPPMGVENFSVRERKPVSPPERPAGMGSFLPAVIEYR
jgi:hypothetical protein